MSKNGIMFECPKCYRVRVSLTPKVFPICTGIETQNIQAGHEPVSMNMICIVPESIVNLKIDYGMLAYDVAEAIAKTADEHKLDLGDRAITHNLPHFIAMCVATQRRLDRNTTNES